MRLCSHVYSSCLVRHNFDSAEPWFGNSRSAVASTEWTSNSVPYASNTTALTDNAVLEEAIIIAPLSRFRRRCYTKTAQIRLAGPGRFKKIGVTLACNPLVPWWAILVSNQ